MFLGKPLANATIIRRTILIKINHILQTGGIKVLSTMSKIFAFIIFPLNWMFQKLEIVALNLILNIHKNVLHLI